MSFLIDVEKVCAEFLRTELTGVKISTVYPTDFYSNPPQVVIQLATIDVTSAKFVGNYGMDISVCAAPDRAAAFTVASDVFEAFLQAWLSGTSIGSGVFVGNVSMSRPPIRVETVEVPFGVSRLSMGLTFTSRVPRA